MEMDDENDEEPPAPGTEEDGSGRSLLASGSVGLKVGGASAGHSSVRVARSVLERASFLFLTQDMDSSPLGRGQKRKAGPMGKSITIGSSPILYTQPVASAGKNT